MTEVQLVDAHASRLSELGRQIDDLRQSLQQTVVEQAVEIGNRLIQAKKLLRHGQWLPWLHDRKMSERSAQNYMKMARHDYELRSSNPKRVSDFVKQSYREALRATQEAEGEPSRGPVDELSAKRQFEKRRTESIERLTTRMQQVAGRYGAAAVAKAQNAYQVPVNGLVLDEAEAMIDARERDRKITTIDLQVHNEKVDLPVPFKERDGPASPDLKIINSGRLQVAGGYRSPPEPHQVDLEEAIAATESKKRVTAATLGKIKPMERDKIPEAQKEEGKNFLHALRLLHQMRCEPENLARMAWPEHWREQIDGNLADAASFIADFVEAWNRGGRP